MLEFFKKKIDNDNKWRDIINCMDEIKLKCKDETKRNGQTIVQQ